MKVLRLLESIFTSIDEPSQNFSSICSERYPEQITMSFIPNFLNDSICHCKIGLPFISKRPLGISFVTGHILLAKPPAIIRAIISHHQRRKTKVFLPLPSFPFL